MIVARRAALILIGAGFLASPERVLAQAAPTPKPGDAFGEEVTLAAKTILSSKGSANPRSRTHWRLRMEFDVGTSLESMSATHRRRLSRKPYTTR